MTGLRRRAPAEQEPLRIIHVADYGGPYPGSFIPMLLAGARAARGRGWTTESVFPERARGRDWLGLVEAEGIPIRLAPATPRRAGEPRIREVLADDSRPTILHAHFGAYDLPALGAARGRAGTFVFWHKHANPPPGLAVGLRHFVKYGLLARRAAGILCVAPDIAEAMRRRGAPARLVELFPNAIDCSRFPLIAAAEREAARKALGVTADTAVLLHFGWDWNIKGGDVLLGAVRLLRAEGRRVLAVVVRGGEQARSLAARLGVEDSLVDLPPVEDVRSLYAFADVFVSCSRSEGMPFSIAEALCSGLAVAATDLPGPAMQCQGLGACRLTAIDDRDVARGIAELLDRDTVEAAADAGVGRASVLERSDLGPWADRLMAVYERAAFPVP